MKGRVDKSDRVDSVETSYIYTDELYIRTPRRQGGTLPWGPENHLKKTALYRSSLSKMDAQGETQRACMPSMGPGAEELACPTVESTPPEKLQERKGSALKLLSHEFMVDFEDRH